MGTPMKLNKDIIPIKFSERGEHPEKKFQDKLRNLLLSFKLTETGYELITNEFYSFDVLIFPQYSPVRTNKNIIYLKRRDGKEIDHELFEKIKMIHKTRFGYDLNLKISKQKILLSHTTSLIMESLVNFGPNELFSISKIFRNKDERKEKTQIDICLCNRSIPEVITFMENLYSSLLNKRIGIKLTSNFHYFCEPSFSFSCHFKDKGKSNKIVLGTGGFMRDNLVQLLNEKYPSKRVDNVVLIGFPYQKILNLSLGQKYDNWDIDYNHIKTCRS